MGALEFIPETNRERRTEKIDVKSLADLAERIFVERENARIMPEAVSYTHLLSPVSEYYLN